MLDGKGQELGGGIHPHCTTLHWIQKGSGLANCHDFLPYFVTLSLVFILTCVP
jgi:hypothetical protein